MLSILLRIAPVLLPALWLLVTIVILAACRSAARADDDRGRGGRANRSAQRGGGSPASLC
jgi:hypothetical protein